MSDQEFRVVTRKKWLARKSLDKRRPLYTNQADNELSEVDIPKFLTRLQRVRDQLEYSDYFQLALGTLSEGLKELGTDKFSRVVCFGLGSFTRSNQALHQLAFILELQKHFEITDTFYFDPIFLDCEKEMLTTLGCNVMKENCDARYPAECITLFYLPHLPNPLTNNLLWSNWKPEMLSKAVLINNSFETLCSNKPVSFLRMDSRCILEILPYTKEFALDDCYETRNVFNDLAVHVFPRDLLPEMDWEAWALKEIVKNDAGELVTIGALEKLTIS